MVGAIVKELKKLKAEGKIAVVPVDDTILRAIGRKKRKSRGGAWLAATAPRSETDSWIHVEPVPIGVKKGKYPHGVRTNAVQTHSDGGR